MIDCLVKLLVGLQFRGTEVVLLFVERFVGVTLTCQAKEMASVGIAANAVMRRSPLNSFLTRTDLLSGAQEIRVSALSQSLPDQHPIRSATNGRALSLISANAGKCAERNAETAAKNITPAAGYYTFVDSEITALPAAREGNRMAIGGHYIGREARKALAITGDITVANMESLVESLLSEKGQSTEDYRQRAEMFGKIAEFFSKRRVDNAEQKRFWTGGASEIASTMQVIVDVVLAEEGRSATDYKCRAQLFAKSAEVFPFTADIRSS